MCGVEWDVSFIYTPSLPPEIDQSPKPEARKEAMSDSKRMDNPLVPISGSDNSRDHNQPAYCRPHLQRHPIGARHERHL